MSWGSASTASDSPTVAGLESSDTSTNQQAVPVRWWIGPGKCPLTWVVPEVYNQKTTEIRTKAGKSDTVTGYKYYVDVAGIGGLGLIRRIRWIKSGNTVVWTGNVVRPDDPAHPDYWEVKIATSVGDFYCAWGRHNQPRDTHLLSALGAANPALRHPAYRYQFRVVILSYYCGENTTTVPVTVLGADREPTPAIGNFPAQGSEQGESVVAGILELATHPIFGAGLSAKYFTVSEWQNLSAAVIARVGCLAPALDREQPLRDVVKDLQSYYDGWCRIENGKIHPGCFPHDGTVPDGLTELSVHDFVDRPKVKASTPSTAVNEVVVKFRDGADYLEEKSVSESASDNVHARQAHDPKTLSMPAFITQAQAQAYAAEAAATGAEGEFTGDSVKVRASRLKWADGTPLRAGDNFNLDLIAPQVDQVSRVTQRVDPFHGAPQISFTAEPGIYPTPYVSPGNLRPELGSPVPQAIAQARVLELTPALAGSAIGLPIAILAKRPKGAFADQPDLTTKNVTGFNLWYSVSGASYDSFGHVSSWGVRATLRTALAASSASATVQLVLDADNLDIDRIGPQSAQAQANDELLAVIGDEIFSAGSLSIAALNYDFSCTRARLGTRAAAHAAGDECWLVWRDEISAFTHKGFIEDQDRWFKLQPYTRGRTLELADVDPITYHFRDRAPEKPVIVINALPAGLVVGVTYGVSGQISDVNGDLKSYVVEAAMLTGPGGTIDSKIALQSGDFEPDDKALYTYKTAVVFPSAGTWRIVVRAYDDTGKFTRVQTGELTVAAGNGGYNGPDDGVTPNAVSGVTVTPGFGMFVLNWTDPTNTRIDLVRIYEAETAVKPVQWSFIAIAGQQFVFRTGLPNSATRYYWFEVLAKNGRTSAVAGPVSATTIAGIGLTNLVPGMTMVEIVNALPATANFKGRTVFLTTDNKLYRWTNDVIGTGTTYWSRTIDGVDLAVGTVVAGALSAGAVTAFAVGTNEIIANTANLKDAIITGAKIALLEVGTGHMQDLSVTTLKVAGDAITAAVTATAAEVAIAAGTNEDLISAVIVTTGGRVKVDFQFTLEFSSGGSTRAAVYRNGVSKKLAHMTMPWANNDSRSFFFVDTPPAGTYTYLVRMENPNDDVTAREIAIALVETKK